MSDVEPGICFDSVWRLINENVCVSTQHKFLKNGTSITQQSPVHHNSSGLSFHTHSYLYLKATFQCQYN